MKGGKPANNRKPPILPILGLIVGLALLASPVVFDLVQGWRDSNAISTMTDAVDSQDDAQLQKLWKQAQAYNRRLAGKKVSAKTQILSYEDQLKVEGTEAISWLEIPTLSIDLPVYRGTSDTALASGIGHLEESSLPVGGASTHCVLTGHSGMYNARMLDDLQEMQEGDLFAIHTLGRELVYEVVDIQVVLPDEVDSLSIVDGEDLCTLVTCTPYGVNDHRLLVTGKRTNKQLKSKSSVQKTLSRLTNKRALPFEVCFLLVLAVAVGIALARKRRRRKANGNKMEVSRD